MRKQILPLIILLAGIGMSTTACTYKGKCDCGSVTVEDEYDNKEDYEDAKEVCEETLDCEWTRVL